MSKPIDGGPAFPGPGGKYDVLTDQNPGMSLLDYLAAAALQGLLAAGTSWSEHGKISAWAYDLGYAMLAEKERRMRGEA